MTDSITIEENVVPVTINVIPMHIQYTGPAKTNEYFTASRTTEQFGAKTVDVAFFRGCKLVGEKIPLSNHTGYIMNSTEILSLPKVTEGEYGDDDPFANGDVKTIKSFTPVAQFDEITIFGHDAPAASSNPWGLLDEWNSIADIIHGK